MAVTVRRLTPNERAKHLANSHYEELKERTLASAAGRLRSEGIVTISRADLEDAYQQGWQGVCHHVTAGKPVSSLGVCSSSRFIAARSIYVGRRTSEGAWTLVLMSKLWSGISRRGSTIRSGSSISCVRLRERLNENERRAFALCLLHGYKRAEAADLLGVERIVFERIMDGATKKLGGIVAGLQARGCGDDEWSRALRAYARGDLPGDGHDHRRVRDHLERDKCEACCRYVRGLEGPAALALPGSLNDKNCRPPSGPHAAANSEQGACRLPPPRNLAAYVHEPREPEYVRPRHGRPAPLT